MTKPAFKIVADGDNVTRAVADRLVSLRITDEAGQTSDSLEITLDDRASRVPVPRSGAWLKVWLGYSTGGKLPVYMGSFAVDDVDLSGGPRSMTIKATAAQTAPELVKGQKSQSWHGKTLGEVAQEIGKRNGLQVVIKGNLASTQIKHEDQTNESDQAFLTRLAEKHRGSGRRDDHPQAHRCNLLAGEPEEQGGIRQGQRPLPRSHHPEREDDQRRGRCRGPAGIRGSPALPFPGGSAEGR